MNHYLLLILIMASMGIFGGVINFFTLYRGERNWLYFFFQNIFIGLGAASLVPLLLKTAASEMLADFGTTIPWRPDYFILAGFCLLSALVARVFVRPYRTAESKQDHQPKKKTGHPETLESQSPAEEPFLPKEQVPRAPSAPEQHPVPTSEQNEVVPNREVPIMEDPKVSKDAKLVLATLKQPDYIFKSIAEIQDEVDISGSYLELILERLESADFVTTIERDDEIFWGLTYKGYNYSTN